MQFLVACASRVCVARHFLPRIELMPEKRFLFLPTLTHAVGSSFLRRRIDALQ